VDSVTFALKVKLLLL